MAPYEKSPTTHSSQYPYYGRSTNCELSSVVSDAKNGMPSSPVVEWVSVSNEDMQYMNFGRRGVNMFVGGLGKLRPEQINYEARVTHETGGDKDESRSVDSGNSQRMIIKKGVEWSVDYDTRATTPGEEER